MKRSVSIWELLGIMLAFCVAGTIRFCYGSFRIDPYVPLCPLSNQFTLYNSMWYMLLMVAFVIMLYDYYRSYQKVTWLNICAFAGVFIIFYCAKKYT